MGNFGNNLKALRAINGESRAALSASVGVTEQTIKRYERGSNEPALDVAVRIADHYSVSLDDMCKRTVSAGF